MVWRITFLAFKRLQRILCCFLEALWLESRPCIFTVFNLNEVYFPLVDIELLNSAYISAGLSWVWHLPGGANQWCKWGVIGIWANIKEGIATRACGADNCFSWEVASVAGLVFCKHVYTFISGNSSVWFYFMKEDVGLKVSDSIQKNFEDVSLNMAAILLRVSQLCPNLMEWG